MLRKSKQISFEVDLRNKKKADALYMQHEAAKKLTGIQMDIHLAGCNLVKSRELRCNVRAP